MSIKELTEKVSEEFDIPKSEARETIDFVFDSITETLESGSEVTIPGFGKFSTATQKGREGTAPDGTKWKSETKQVPKFKAATALKDTVA